MSGRLSIEKFGRSRLDFSVLVDNYLVSRVKNTAAFFPIYSMNPIFH